MTQGARIFAGVWAVAAMTVAAPAHASWILGNAYAKLGLGLPNTKITTIVEAFMRWILALVGIIAVLAFAYAGLLFFTSAGDAEQIKQAKSVATWAAVGIIVALLGIILLTAIRAWFDGSTTF